MDETDRDFEHLLQAEDVETVLRNVTPLIRFLVGYYKALIAEGAPDLLAYELTKNVQIELLRGTVGSGKKS